jgi:glycosyltransferase involved in cell wall biosynthesis
LVKWKRVDLLINVIAVLKNKFPRIELVVIGTGPEKTELENLAKSLKLENNIKFIGGVYKAKELGQYLSASSIYILAGMGGLSINDAMCFGKPVICSVCDGTEKKLVRNNYNGFIFKEGDLDDLASKIDYLFSNPEKITQMGLNSERIIKDEVNIHTVINGYVRAFEYIKEIHQK